MFVLLALAVLMLLAGFTVFAIAFESTRASVVCDFVLDRLRLADFDRDACWRFSIC